MKVSRDQAKKILNKIQKRSSFYSITYLKKDNTERKAVAHPNVKKHLKGGKATYNASNPDNIGYYDLGAKGYRSFNIDRLKKIKFAGTTYEVEDEE